MQSAQKGGSRQRSLWHCPTCARVFAKKNQWHSCTRYSIKDHLRLAAPQVIRAYEKLVLRLRQFGPVRIDAVKSSINFASKYHFAGVTIRKDYLRVGFMADRVIDDERIVRVEKLGPGRVAHSVIVHSPDELDDTIMGWLRCAHKLQSR